MEKSLSKLGCNHQQTCYHFCGRNFFCRVAFILHPHDGNSAPLFWVITNQSLRPITVVINRTGLPKRILHNSQKREVRPPTLPYIRGAMGSRSNFQILENILQGLMGIHRLICLFHSFQPLGSTTIQQPTALGLRF